MKLGLRPEYATGDDNEGPPLPPEIFETVVGSLTLAVLAELRANLSQEDQK
jgi:hypothetical protein